MSALFALKFALSSLWAFRLRSMLTAGGILIGVGTIIGTHSVIAGLNSAFHDQIAMLGTGTLYVSKRPWIVLSNWWQYKARPDVDEGDAEYLEERLALAERVVPFVHDRSRVNVGQIELEDVRIIGTGEHWAEMSGIEAAQGRFITEIDEEIGRPVAVVGFDLMKSMQSEGLIVGDQISLGARKFRVVGSMPSRGSIFGRSQDDFVVIPLPVFRRIYGARRSLNIGVIYDPQDLDRGMNELIGAMRARRKLGPEQPNNFSINQQQMFVDFYEKLTGALYAAAAGLAFITLLVGGVGIMNIMLVAVAERTQEIGIRKAIGARPSGILLQFVCEAMLTSGVGGSLGVGLGFALARGVHRYTPLPAFVTPEAVGLGVAFGIFIGLVFGFLPAYRASRLVVVDALRAER